MKILINELIKSFSVLITIRLLGEGVLPEADWGKPSTRN